MRETDRCEFSEFSFGYALTDNAIHSGAWGGATGGPRFLSLSEEGGTGGGFDVELPFRALPLFLQFKIPQVMRRRSKRMPAGFSKPYYRMHLRTRRENASGQTQHEQMIDLEAQFPLCVYYVTPRFASSKELDQHYLARRVADESEWFAPSAIGTLDRNDHCVAYQPASTDYEVQSEPIWKNEGRYRFPEVSDRLLGRLKQTPPSDPTEWLARLTIRLTEGLGMDEPIVGFMNQAMTMLHPEMFMEAKRIESDAKPKRTPRRPRRDRRKTTRFLRHLHDLSFFLNSRLDSRLLIAFAQSSPS